MLFFINQNAKIVACTLLFSEIALQTKSGKYFQIRLFPRFGGKNGDVPSMRMQVILDSSFRPPGFSPIWGGRKGEFRDWTILLFVCTPKFCKKHCFQFLLGLTMVPRENKSNAYTKFGGQTKSIMVFSGMANNGCEGD